MFKRWLGLRLLSSHSRLHGIVATGCPWVFDDDEAEAVDVPRQFTKLKRSLMPYLVAAGQEAHRTARR